MIDQGALGQRNGRSIGITRLTVLATAGHDAGNPLGDQLHGLFILARQADESRGETSGLRTDRRASGGRCMRRGGSGGRSHGCGAAPSVNGHALGCDLP